MRGPVAALALVFQAAASGCATATERVDAGADDAAAVDVHDGGAPDAFYCCPDAGQVESCFESEDVRVLRVGGAQPCESLEVSGSGSATAADLDSTIGTPLRIERLDPGSVVLRTQVASCPVGAGIDPGAPGGFVWSWLTGPGGTCASSGATSGGCADASHLARVELDGVFRGDFAELRIAGSDVRWNVEVCLE